MGTPAQSGRPGEVGTAMVEEALAAGFDPGQIAGQVIDGVICQIRKTIGLSC